MPVNRETDRPRPWTDQAREAMAASGDVDGLWQLLTTRPRDLLDSEQTFRQLLQAAGVRARQDPAAYSAEVFARLVALTSYLVLRTHYLAGRAIAGHDLQRSRHADGDVPSEFAEVILPRLFELHSHLATLLQAQASTARLWQLARPRQSPGGRPVRPVRQRPGGRCGKPQRGTPPGKPPPRRQPANAPDVPATVATRLRNGTTETGHG